MKSILVALDASPRAAHVLDTAVTIGVALGALVKVYRAVSLPPEHPAAAHESHRDSLEEFLGREAEEQLRLLVGARPGVQVERVVPEYGAPWRLICDKGRSLDVDLLVIGSHGYGGWDRLLGTTAASVVNHATTSVLVVRGR